MHVWLDGTWLARDDAQVSVFDAGLQHGVGLFETMLAKNGRVFRVRAHLERLVNSATELRLTQSLNIEPLAEAVQLTLEKNALTEARVRLTITGGDLNLLQQSGGRASHDPTILIVAQPPTPYSPEIFASGVRVTCAAPRLNPLDPFASHKTLWYWPRLASLQAAGAAGASESLHFSVIHELACGCVSNVFLVRGDTLLTPLARGEEPVGGLPAPVLPGITRATIIELAEAAGLAVERRGLKINDVLAADELFLTNSSWGVLPVVAVEASSIHNGKPGPRTLEMREAWRGCVDRETSER